jgi:hypothetical protein
LGQKTGDESVVHRRKYMRGGRDIGRENEPQKKGHEIARFE